MKLKDLSRFFSFYNDMQDVEVIFITVPSSGQLPDKHFHIDAVQFDKEHITLISYETLESETGSSNGCAEEQAVSPTPLPLTIGRLREILTELDNDDAVIRFVDDLAVNSNSVAAFRLDTTKDSVVFASTPHR